MNSNVKQTNFELKNEDNFILALTEKWLDHNDFLIILHTMKVIQCLLRGL